MHGPEVDLTNCFIYIARIKIGPNVKSIALLQILIISTDFCPCAHSVPNHIWTKSRRQLVHNKFCRKTPNLIGLNCFWLLASYPVTLSKTVGILKFKVRSLKNGNDTQNHPTKQTWKVTWLLCCLRNITFALTVDISTQTLHAELFNYWISTSKFWTFLYFIQTLSHS